MLDGKLAQILKNLGLIEILYLFPDKNSEPSHINDSQKINSIWTTPNLIQQSLSIMLHYFKLGNYRCFIVNFSHKSIIGKGFILIVRSEIKRLTTNQPKAMLNYL